MVRLLLYVALVLVLGFGFAWLADRPGALVITWQGQQIEMSLMVAVSAVVALIAIIMFGWWLIKSLLTSPQVVTRYFRARKRDRGYQALSTGLIAAGAGDAATARKMTQRTSGLLSADQEPLIHLLDAQTALIEGNNDAARAKFEAMVDDPETRELGLRGLYLEARRLGAAEAAQHYAEQAAELAPHLPWAAEAALGYRSAEGAWDDAIRLLEKQRVARVLDKAEADRKKAVLLTARGMDKLEKGDIAGARVDAIEANRLAPDLVPAGVTAAQALFRENNLRKGSRLLEKLWKAAPHPDVAETYVRARPGDSTLDRLKRAQKLQSIKRNHVESAYTVARAALDAQEMSLARENAEAAARLGAREGIYLLLADIEEADTGDQGRVRHWLAQAVRAPRDPAWTADGYVSEHWAPVSPVSGRSRRLRVESAGRADRRTGSKTEKQCAPTPNRRSNRFPRLRRQCRSSRQRHPLCSGMTASTFRQRPTARPCSRKRPPKPLRKNRPHPNPCRSQSLNRSPRQSLSPNRSLSPNLNPRWPRNLSKKRKPSRTPKATTSEPADGVESENKDRPAIASEEPAPIDQAAARDSVHVDEAVREAAASGETHIVTDAVGEDSKKPKEAAFVTKPPDNPGVRETEAEEPPKSRFRLF